jgi:hypothetical protein
VSEPIKLRLPVGWRLLEIGFSTPGLKLSDGVSGAWLFAIASEVTDGQRAFYSVLEAWAADPATRAEAVSAGHPFNYGDAIERIDPASWRAHGLVLLHLAAAEHVDLDHDEVLVDAWEVRAP